MKRVSVFVLAAALLVVATTRISGQITGSQIIKEGGYADRLYALNGGIGKSGDASAWFNMLVPPGTAVDISAYAHLIKHGNDWMLFDTSTPDIYATTPNGSGGALNGIRWMKTQDQTMAAQLKLAGITPDDIKYIGISHNHADHTGNIYQFKNSSVLIQRREYDQIFEGAGGPAAPPNFQGQIFERNHTVKLLDGDYDVFGDGSVLLFFVGGHTLGSQVCLVRLRNTGYVLLTGDAVHFRSNYDTRRIPRVANGNDENHWLWSVTGAFDRMAALLSHYKGQMWVHHDIDDYKGRKFAPAFYE